jgi:TonB-linked SusC/RagA family outer membrane protein
MNKNDHIKVKPHESIFGFLLISLFLLSANLFAINSGDFKNFTQEENKTISNQISVKEAFMLISKKTSYHFFYNNELKGLETKVRFKNKADIKDTLNNLLKNTDLEYKIDGNEILIRERQTVSKNNTKINKKPKKTIQSNIISGLVFDDYNMPLPGVNVQVVGKATGATTDFDGKFTLAANPEDSLEFSYMGFKNQTIKVGQKTTFKIVMQPSSNTLDEIIISGVAAGTSKKKMSVSVSKIKAEDFNMVPQSSVSASLSGKLAGVNITSLNGSPGSGSSITLRGATSLTGNQNPLILIDGVIMSGSLADINVDDVESIEVVKGAAASALYGSKAGNGVIVITSKRGKGNGKNKIAITFRSRYGVEQISKYLDLADSHYYELAPNWLNATTFTKYNDVSYPSGYVSGFDPDIVGNRVPKYDHYMDLPYRVNNNLQKEMFTNGSSNTNYIGIGYNNDKTNIFISFENNKDKGIVVETGGYKRNSMRANVDYKVTNKLKFSSSNNFIYTNYDFTGSGLSSFSRVLKLEPDTDLFKKNPDGQPYNYLPNNWQRLISNPLYDLWRRDRSSSKLRFLGSYKLKYTINNWVNAEISYAVESQNYKRTNTTPAGTYTNYNSEENIINQLSNDLVGRYNSETLNQNIATTLNFSQSWNELDFKGKIKYQYENYDFLSKSLTADNEKIDILAVNYYAIASFVYKDRYIFDGLFRYDGSSLFGENERWKPYYRLSGAYRVTKDLPISGIEELKIRAAYGTAGQRPGFYAQYETFLENNGLLSKSTLGNKDLKPSKSAEIELGLDMSFLKRFTLETTYSKTNTSDQFLRIPLASHLGGFKFQWKNVGNLETKTFETSLQSKLIKQKNLKWNLGITFDKTTSKITQLDIAPYSTGPRSAFRIEEGVPYGIMYGREFVTTLEQMQTQLPDGDTIEEYSINRDGIVVRTVDIGTIYEKATVVTNPDGSDKTTAIGNTNPEFRMGLNSSITYKNFSFYTLWKWKNGGDIYNGTAQYLVDDLRNPMMDMRFTKPEDKKTVDYYKSLYNRQDLNKFWVEDASYVRLSEVSFYYNHIPKHNKTIKSLRFGILGKNLYTFTNYTGYDPEAGYSGFLFDNYGYPNFRSYTASLELKF